jgi:S1-C subfamily serine protease
MKILLTLIACLSAIPISVRASDLSNEAPRKESVKMAPYEVSESPFGYLGIKRASARFDVFRFITFRGGLAYVQIDELYPDSPGLAAGIVPGDWIVGVNGKAIGKWSFSELRHFGETLEIGQYVLVDIFRPSTHTDLHCDIIIARKPKVVNKTH